MIRAVGLVLLLAGCGGGRPPGLASDGPARAACIAAAERASGSGAVTAPAAPGVAGSDLLVPLSVDGVAWSCRATARGRVVAGSVGPVFE
jgi:hypothetical protein